MQGHRPVVRDSVDYAGKSRMYRRLRRPYMSRYIRYIFRKIPQNRCHKLGNLLIGAVVCELAEAFTVDRLPDKLVEKRYRLRKAGAEGIQLVLLRYYLAAGGTFERMEI